MGNKYSFLAINLCIFAAACSSSSGVPVVRTSQVTQLGLKPTVAGPAAPTIAVQITVDKNTLLNQEFLYGADLQYSDYHDPGFDLDDQSSAIGHIPVNFRVAGNELQLVADDRRLFASDVDHPELLISRYRIISQTDTTLTISGANSAVFLAEVFASTVGSGGDDSLYDRTAKPPRESWIRSFDYASEGAYLLQQTSIVTADGNIVEFMESVFPRKTLAAGAAFQKFALDPSTPKGVPDGFMSRFRFLPGETVYDATAGVTPSGDPRAVAYAAHFDISTRPDGSSPTIDWYVTGNAPDDVLPVLKEAVEGWNRYFHVMKGVARDVVQFKGRLPAGTYIGDPRYNVINWDSKRVAGAAYESQAADPSTGKQSHSLIYMPAAWLQIGLDYWKSGISSDGQSPGGLTKTSIGKSTDRPSMARYGCYKDMRDSIALVTSGRLSRAEVKQFSDQLLKQTLFHEVGHSLGFAHNFEGSLSFNRADTHPIATNSIMDYNDYEIERQAFDAVDSANGPLLEYDRQGLSVIYNNHQDIADSDPVVPVCNDAESDNLTNGIDPICIRYDIENDPTLSVETAIKRVNQATLTGDISLAQALANVPDLVVSDDAVKAARSGDDVKALTSQLGNGLAGALGFYYVSGKAALGYTVRTNARALLNYEDGILPAGYSEEQMRGREYEGVLAALGATDLPAPVQSALAAAKQAGMAKIAMAPYFSLVAPSSEASQELAALSASLDKAVAGFSQGETSNLATMRATVLKKLALVAGDGTALYFGTLNQKAYDYEKDVNGLLLNAITGAASQQEKLAAAGALVTYKGRLNGDPAIDAATKAITAARASAITLADRDNAEAILAVLTK